MAPRELPCAPVLERGGVVPVANELQEQVVLTIVLTVVLTIARTKHCR